MPELLPDEQVRLLAAARNPDGSRRFYPLGLHPATTRLREEWQKLDRLPETPERDEALAYVERELAMFEAAETEAKRGYLAASGGTYAHVAEFASPPLILRSDRPEGWIGVTPQRLLRTDRRDVCEVVTLYQRVRSRGGIQGWPRFGRTRRVDPAREEVVKLLPSSPPVRGERVLVDGLPCRVTRCRVRWNGYRWRIKSLRVKREDPYG